MMKYSQTCDVILFHLQPFIENLNTALGQIKSVSKESVLSDLQQIEENMQKIYLFASEGETQNVYGVFKKRIENHGKIFGVAGNKSWEE